jgi:uncharacterized protein (TIGR00730 family)
MKSCCVFCGSSPGARPEYREAAVALGREIAGRGLRLVYGGAGVGLMGAVADAAIEAGGEVVGVIPHALAKHEVMHHGLTELHFVDSMHERKAMLGDMADAFVALPGGLGTLEELLEVLTWAQLGIHRRPCGLLNVGGYYDGLLAMVDHAVKERFVREEHRGLLIAEESPGDLLDRCEAYEPVLLGKWLDREQR